MKATLKRYAVALFILGIVVSLMLAATLGVTQFEKKMFKGVEIKPRGEHLE